VGFGRNSARSDRRSGNFEPRSRGRLDRLEQLNRKYRRDAAAMMVILRATAGGFDERVNEVEDA
jgi:glycine cleavage system protein P-like pyridoxal-binding family